MRLARSLRCGGALVAICLAATYAQAQDDDTRGSSETVGQFTALRSEVSEVRAKMNATVTGGYEQGPTCGCNAQAEPSCGCQASCGGCGCDAGCAAACCEDSCCDCCSLPGCSCGWYVAAEAVWMKPYWRSFDALFVTTDPAGPDFFSTSQGYEYGFDPTARFTAGYTGCNGLGVRASWWRYDNDSDVTAATVGADQTVGTRFISSSTVGNTVSTQQSLELQTLDLEFTNCFQACGGEMVTGFGVRYARFALDVRDRNVTNAGALVSSFDFDQSLEGLGPTLALDFIRPLCFSGFSFYSNLRGSVVFGTGREDSLRVVPGTNRFDAVEADEVQAIADLQLALQYCRGGWFARGGWQAQYWDQVARTDVFNFAAQRATALCMCWHVGMVLKPAGGVDQ